MKLSLGFAVKTEVTECLGGAAQDQWFWRTHCTLALTPGAFVVALIRTFLVLIEVWRIHFGILAPADFLPLLALPFGALGTPYYGLAVMTIARGLRTFLCCGKLTVALLTSDGFLRLAQQRGV